MADHIPEEAKNFKLLGHDSSAAWGGGSIVEINKGFAYVGAVGSASYNGPEGFTVHDVRDPRKPKKVAEVKSPPGVHSHKLRVVDGDIPLCELRAARRRRRPQRPHRPVHLRHLQGRRAEADRLLRHCPAPARTASASTTSASSRSCRTTRRAGTSRVIWTLDIKDPTKPEVVSQWGLPWMKATTATATTARRHPHEEAVTLHGPPTIRGNRMYCAWWGGGISVIDCSDLRNMKLVGHLSWAPPFPGSNHTCWPLGDRPYLICTDEARAKQKYWDAQFMWVIDARKEDKLVPIATFMPDREKYFNRPGRYGAHNILEHLPADGPWKDIVFLTYFNAGLRAVNVSDPFHPKEIGCYVPALEGDRPAVQSNDIGTAGTDRPRRAGMHILEYTGRHAWPACRLTLPEGWARRA